MESKQPDFEERWIAHLRKNYKTMDYWSCVLCAERKLFMSDTGLWNHALHNHHLILPRDPTERTIYRRDYITGSKVKSSEDQRTPDDEPILSAQANSPRSTITTEVAKDEDKHGRHGLLNPPASPYATRSLSELQALDLDKETPQGSNEFMIDLSVDGQEALDQPRKRAAVGDGISAGSGSPYRDRDSSPPPRRSKVRPKSAPLRLSPDTDDLAQEMFDIQRPSVRGKRQLWTPNDGPLTRASFVDPPNIAAIQDQRSSTKQLQYEDWKAPSSVVNGRRQTEDESDAPSPGRSKPIPKPCREVTKGVDGRYVCTWIGCTEESFARKCEWGKHMDKHDRPYKCPVDDEKMPSFTCSGRLLRIQQEIHGPQSAPRSNWWDFIRPFGSPPESSHNVSAKLHQNRPSFPDKKPPENRRKILRVRIRDREHQACPDSGSEKNIIEESFAIKHDFTIRRRPKDVKQFQLGNGKIVWSVGRVCVPVELPGSTFGQKKRWFHVLPNCPVPLILGMKFLKEAEILTKNRHLLESCPPDLGNISSLLWIGSPRQRMKCSLDGQDLMAVADTGSDLNLMSLKCAKRGKFHIDRRRECRQRVQVGDGSEAETIGQVYVSNLGLDWRSPETESSESPALSNLPLGPSDPNLVTSTASILPNAESESFGAIFHVLPGLPCDVIFGRDLLEITNAFNLCPELSGAQQFDNNNQFELNILISLGSISLAIPIPRRKRRVATVESAREQHDNERHAEMYRRSQKDEEIALLPVHDQERAKTSESRRAVAWDTLHVNCVYCCQA